jgi:hypothetical protein
MGTFKEMYHDKENGMSNEELMGLEKQCILADVSGVMDEVLYSIDRVKYYGDGVDLETLQRIRTDLKRILSTYS